MSTMKKTTMSAVMVLALAMSLCFAGIPAAFAANTGTTDVSIQADVGQINVTVPAEIPATLNADNSLTYPTDAKLENGSFFAIHVSNLSATDAGADYRLLSQTDFGASSAEDILWTTVNQVDLKATTPFTPGNKWNMQAAGTAGDADKLALTFAGAAKNVVKMPVEAAAAYQITWTVAAGASS